MDTNTHLLKMAAQIADNFKAHAPEIAADKLAKHLKAFWEPRMKAALFTQLETNPDALPPVVKDAAQRLKAASA